MTVTNDFLPFATGAGANTIDQATYQALVARSGGFTAGVASSAQLNKIWRQASIMSAMIGQFINDIGGVDAIDDGTIATLLTNFERAFQSGVMNYAVAGGTANAITATLNPAPASLPDGMAIRIKIAAANTGAATLNVNGLGAQSIVSVTGGALSAGDLPAGSIVTLVKNGSNWYLGNIEISAFRRRLTANTTYYVNATTGSDNNDGSSGSPWATLTKAANVIQTAIDLNGFTVTISVANGTYAAGFSIGGYVPGQTSVQSIQVIGNVTTPTSCYVNDASAPAFAASNGAAFQVKGFQVSASSTVAQNGSGIYASTGGIISYESMYFNACYYSQVFAELGGYCVASGANTINGNSQSHILAKDSGTISIAGFLITLSGGPTLSGAFAAVETGSIQAASATFSGSATGPRYYANANGAIKTGGGGASFFPGSVAGSVNAGGQYL